MRTMSTSSCPTPTVSMSTISRPAASSTSAASAGRLREAAQVAARRHAADEHAGVGGVRLHADAIAQDCAAGKRARRIDRDDANGWSSPADLDDQPIDQRALAGAGRARHAYQIGVAGLRKDPADELAPFGRLVLDKADGARDRARIALEHAVRERWAERGAGGSCHWLSS